MFMSLLYLCTSLVLSIMWLPSLHYYISLGQSVSYLYNILILLIQLYIIGDKLINRIYYYVKKINSLCELHYLQLSVPKVNVLLSLCFTFIAIKNNYTNIEVVWLFDMFLLDYKVMMDPSGVDNIIAESSAMGAGNSGTGGIPPQNNNNVPIIAGDGQDKSDSNSNKKRIRWASPIETIETIEDRLSKQPRLSFSYPQEQEPVQTQAPVQPQLEVQAQAQTQAQVQAHSRSVTNLNTSTSTNVEPVQTKYDRNYTNAFQQTDILDINQKTQALIEQVGKGNIKNSTIKELGLTNVQKNWLRDCMLSDPGVGKRVSGNFTNNNIDNYKLSKPVLRFLLLKNYK